MQNGLINTFCEIRDVVMLSEAFDVVSAPPRLESVRWSVPNLHLTKLFTKSCCQSRFPHIFVNLFFTLAMMVPAPPRLESVRWSLPNLSSNSRERVPY